MAWRKARCVERFEVCDHVIESGTDVDYREFTCGLIQITDSSEEIDLPPSIFLKYFEKISN